MHLAATLKSRLADELSHYLRANRAKVIVAMVATTTLIAFVDWAVEPNLGLGFLYFFPVVVAGAALNRWQVVVVAIACSILRESFSPFSWQPDSVARMSMVFFAFAGTGFFVSEMARNRRLVIEHLKQIEQESELRREAEEQQRILIESSPAAILMLDSERRVLMANEAAHRLLDCAPGALTGRSVGAYIPALATVPVSGNDARSLRTVMECRGRRSGGDPFLASLWFSTYQISSGPRIAAIVMDHSEDLRDREELGLHRMLTSTRILIGAVSHEIRNFCGAINVAYANLARVDSLALNPDFQALGTMLEALEKIASTELRHPADDCAGGVDLSALLDELRIVIGPALRESDIALHWDVPSDLPVVRADRETVLQVFLNLIKNSQRALEREATKELTISGSRERDCVVIRIRDTGGGVPVPDRLFQPYQRGAESTGLGLYISRALVRAFQGELRYEPQPSGCCFAVELPAKTGTQRERK